jgi:hypothetical protein
LRFLLPLLLVGLFSASLIILIAVRIEADALEHQVQQRGDALASTVAVLSDRFGASPEFQATISALVTEHGVTRLVVVGEDGGILASNRRDEQGLTLSSLEDQALLLGRSSAGHPSGRSVVQRSVLLAAVPDGDRGLRAQVPVVLDTTAIDNTVRGTLVILALLCLIAVLTSLAVGWYVVSRVVLRPARAIIHTMSSRGASDLRARVPDLGHHALG